MIVEFKNVFLIGGIFFKLGANILVEFKVFLIGGIFLKLGANMLVEYEKKF